MVASLLGPLLVPRAGLTQVEGHLVFAVGRNLGKGAPVQEPQRLLALVASLGVDGNTHLTEAWLEPDPLQVWPGALSGPHNASSSYLLLPRMWEQC